MLVRSEAAQAAPPGPRGGARLASLGNDRDALRVQKAIGAVGIGNGEFTVTGHLPTYFGDASVCNQVLNNTLTLFDMRLGRADGHRGTLLFDFPSIKLSSGAPTVPGKSQDVMIQANVQAIMHAALGYTMSVSRIWYLPTS